MSQPMLVIGDVHGCLKTLKALIALVEPTRRICMVGDLIDRGPNSIGVVDYVMANKARIDCVRGNHELMAQECRDGLRTGYQWTHNGGDRVYGEYFSPGGGGQKKFDRHLDFFDSLPAYRSYLDSVRPDGRYLMVSHSIITNKNVDLCVGNEGIYWGRHFPEKDVSEGEWFNVFGHTPTPYMWPGGRGDPQAFEPFIDQENFWANIDTGCVFEGGRLTGLLFPEMTVIQVDNLDFERELHVGG